MSAFLLLARGPADSDSLVLSGLSLPVTLTFSGQTPGRNRGRCAADDQRPGTVLGPGGPGAPPESPVTVPSESIFIIRVMLASVTLVLVALRLRVG